MSEDPAPLVARIPAGESLMGADGESDGERPAHRVYLDEFYLGIHTVTNEDYAHFVNETGHPPPAIREIPSVVPQDQQDAFRELSAPFVWKDGQPDPARARHPVTLVTYNDATAYCTWLQSRTGKPFRLPSEAEWEHAARGGVDHHRYPWGDEIDPSRANYLVDPALKSQRSTAEVGSFPANGFRLFDMSGNVWQWVSDWYAPDYYARAQYLNPPGPDSGHLRIVRGGSWVNHDTSLLRSAYRHLVPADSYSYSIGFRVAYSVR